MEAVQISIPTVFCGSLGHKDPGPRIDITMPRWLRITEEEIRMTLVVAGREVSFLVSSGSEHSVLNSFSGGALSSDSCEASGVAMPKRKIQFTRALPCFWYGASFTHQFLFIPESYTPVLGRDLLSRIRASIGSGVRQLDLNAYLQRMHLWEDELPGQEIPCPILGENRLLIMGTYFFFEGGVDLEGKTEETDLEALVDAHVDRRLWEDDVPGRPNTATPVNIHLSSCACLYQTQKPLAPEAKAGLQPLIDRFLKCGLLKPCTSPCNSSIVPVEEENGKYRLVLDLRALNQALPPMGPRESDPLNILGEIPPDYCWLTVFNVSFCVPLDEASQYLFAFEWTDGKGRTRQLTWTVMPQGFRDTSRYMAEALSRDLGNLRLDQGKVLHYFNDILICSPTRGLAALHAVQALNFFAQQGYKASRRKVQLVTWNVQYMGLQLTSREVMLSYERVNAICCLPRPTTKSELRAILGKMNFCRQWIVSYQLKAKPLYEALRGGGRYLRYWGPDQENAFEQLKQEIDMAQALDLPRMDKPFQLFTTEAQGVALGVLTQPVGPVRHCVGYLSQQLDPVAQNWPKRLRPLAATAELIKMASKLSLGQPLEVFSPHPLTNLLEQEAPCWLTAKRLRKYNDLILENPNVTLQTCNALNMSSLLPHDVEGTHGRWNR